MVFAGAASSLLPMAYYFGLRFTVGTVATWAGWSLKHQAYKGGLPKLNLKPFRRSAARGKEAGRKLPKNAQSLATVTNQVSGQRDNAAKVIQNGKNQESIFTRCRLCLA